MDISLSDRILILLREMGPLTVDEISRYLSADINSIIDEMKYLENDKLVTKSKKGIILRKEVYNLTPTGADEAEKALEKVRALTSKFLTPLSPSEIEQLLNELTPIIPLLMLLGLIPIELLIMAGLMPITLNQQGSN